jgi:hypothetical protein
LAPWRHAGSLGRSSVPRGDCHRVREDGASAVATERENGHGSDGRADARTRIHS